MSDPGLNEPGADRMHDWIPLSTLEFDALSALLVRALSGPLPGCAAQRVMAPGPRRPGWTPGHVPPGARPSAALVLLYPDGDGRPALVLTERSARLQRHAGQISLPGGVVDEGETHVEAALREAREEIGVDPALIEVLGSLSPLHIPVSGFALQPVVGRLAARPVFRPDPSEVAAVVEATIAELADPERHGREEMRRPPGVLDVPFFRVGERQVWGATAMILAELLALLASAQPRPPSARRTPDG